MASKIIHITNDRQHAASAAVETLRNGGVLVFPTETVYGIGVAAGRADALEKMRRLKQRPDEKPFQLLAADIDMAKRVGAVFSPRAERLADAFWPGPLTLVVPDAKGGTLGIRVPASELILEICRNLGEPIISSSANPAGAPPPADAAAADCFGDDADLLLAAGGTAAGIPSTVVRCRGEESETYEILREGGISRENIDAVWNGGHTTDMSKERNERNPACPK